MGGRADIREELRKLKLIAEHTEEWASKVTSFLVVTQDLCKSAAHVLCHLDDDAWEIETLLVAGAETVAEAVSQVVELARTRSTEVVRQFQRKSQGVNHKELHTKVEQASLAVGLAIFETLQLQAEQFGKLSEKSIGAARKRASTLAAKLPSLPRSESGMPHVLMSNGKGGKVWDDGQSEATGTGTDDVELDWDAFDNDLKAMTDAVGMGMATPEEAFRSAKCLDNQPSPEAMYPSPSPEACGSPHAASAEFKALQLRIDELDVEKSSASFRASQAEQRAEDAVRKAVEVQAVADKALERAQRAEEALCRLQREREEWENLHPRHTDDDYNEVRRALKEEQMARLCAEESLRAAEAEARRFREEARAAHEAHAMTQSMARMADEQLSARHSCPDIGDEIDHGRGGLESTARDVGSRSGWVRDRRGSIADGDEGNAGGRPARGARRGSKDGGWGWGARGTGKRASSDGKSGPAEEPGTVPARGGMGLVGRMWGGRAANADAVKAQGAGGGGPKGEEGRREGGGDAPRPGDGGASRPGDGEGYVNPFEGGRAMGSGAGDGYRNPFEPSGGAHGGKASESETAGRGKNQYEAGTAGSQGERPSEVEAAGAGKNPFEGGGPEPAGDGYENPFEAAPSGPAQGGGGSPGPNPFLAPKGGSMKVARDAPVPEGEKDGWNPFDGGAPAGGTNPFGEEPVGAAAGSSQAWNPFG
ncbi:unnamed protein product [Ostreobium quekettii]|uniref:Uncharacterized protein n=1 Tax=Ostreobium quekettii TaxID=121088 RepID=A0A8S1IWU5_9CHLO|nr:unnamed protein product [Ostreobium quekettii]|eukprot:evm.model.scf_547EXC.1 EVM.evm.TU.scf_547EXC.1   scf_547EXC:4400-11939(+)